ncbi:MAG: HIT family protein [Rhizobiales bacterium]|nr:HIT family protein [Hyphomicrobiales bacterium]MBI3673415.1 HIT family protein [Hyphomicrobiales bacterium]
MNATIEKFGYPASLVCDYRFWCVLLRPAQATLAALVLAAKGEARAFSELSEDAFGELPLAIHDIEKGLAAFRPYDRINYLMLMMVDPHVHFHVLPRHAKPQDFDGVRFADPAWPGPPDLKFATELADQPRARLLHALQACWPRT